MTRLGHVLASTAGGHVLAGTAGGLAFLLFHLGIDAGVPLALLAAGGAYGAIRLIWRALAPSAVESGTAAHDLLVSATERLRRLEALGFAAVPMVAQRIETVVRAAALLVADLEPHPERAMESRRLLTFWLDLALRIAEHDARLRDLKGARHPALAKICAMLDEVAAAFAAHADSAAAAELSRLELDLVVLERSLDQERGHD
ncbi:hypothetical protein L2U69_05470 [Zavarzinia compransoris]|uniref:hypothetical protein n=1 Tax=Zavarzinia marina TaxID=2911065 RepID=UPI001F34B658|nr:hypothetical protein [Zavarzinia marina]MCF4165083.1 hypothetical protein [Zavarzinia marina]